MCTSPVLYLGVESVSDVVRLSILAFKRATEMSFRLVVAEILLMRPKHVAMNNCVRHVRCLPI